MEKMSKQALLEQLEARFLANMNRHSGVSWDDVAALIEKDEKAMSVLQNMEQTGGEPDVVTFDNDSNITFVDCSSESPLGRRSLCYDREAWNKRKANKPESTVKDVAVELGITLLTEDEYRHLQTVLECDLKTSSWIETPSSVRERGGALFMDRRYGRVFTYHNGADSYYAARGFRGKYNIKK